MSRAKEPPATSGSNPPPSGFRSAKDLGLELYTYAAFGVCAVATLPFVAVSSLVHRGEVPRQPGRWVRRLGRVAARLTPLWDFSIQGAPPSDVHDRPYVVVANHLSMADPFVLSSLPWDMQWVAKESLFKAPVVGWVMRLGGDVALLRGSGDSVRAMFDQLRRALDGGLSVMLFPEGTRATEGGVGTFKDGAFELALERGVPVLPVAIAGTENCMRKGSGRLARAKAVARILEPISTSAMTAKDVGYLRDLAQSRIVTAARELALELAPELEGELAKRRHEADLADALPASARERRRR